MGASAEVWRGTWASACCLCGFPVVAFRMAKIAQDSAAARAVLAAHLQGFLTRCHVDVVVEGDPPPVGTAVVLSYNEPSFIDVAAFAAVMWPHLDWAAAAEFYGHIPFGKSALRKAQIGLVPRGNRRGTDLLLARMADAARSGARVAWGAEGRISGLDGIGHCKVGGMLLAIRAQVPILPVVFYGGHQAMRFRSLRARGGQVRIRFGEPIPTHGMTEDDARALADRMRGVMQVIYDDLKAQAARQGRS